MRMTGRAWMIGLTLATGLGCAHDRKRCTTLDDCQGGWTCCAGECRELCSEETGCPSADLVCSDGVCQPSPTIPCGTSERRCGDQCIAATSCCGDGECQGGRTCQQGSCLCPSDLGLCGGVCTAGSAQCCNDPDCGDGGACSQGSCSCATDFRLCKGLCIAATSCCDDNDCPGSTCQGGACVGGGCTGGDERCSDNSIQTCVSGSWGTGTSCGTQTCVQSGNSASCQECTNGDQRCNNNVVETCVNGHWGSSASCGAGTCIATGNTATCQTASVCTGSETYVCDDTAVVQCSGTSEVWRLDCANPTGSQSGAGVCIDLGTGVGSWCVMVAGQPCLYWDSAHGAYMNMMCGAGGVPSDSMGCDLAEGCFSGIGQCTPASPFTRFCIGNRLVLDCLDWGVVQTPFTADCAAGAYGYGTCNVTTAVCEDNTPGGMCTVDPVLPPVRCIGGRTCTGVTNGVGTCQ